MSRSDSVAAIIEGRALGFFERNRWRPLRVLSSDIVRASEHGVAVRLSLSDPSDLFDSDQERLAVVWDDARVAVGPVNVTEGSQVVLALESRAGDVATVWGTDSFDAQVMSHGDLNNVEGLQSEVARYNESLGLGAAFGGAVAEASRGATAVGSTFALAVTAGLVLLALVYLPKKNGNP